MAELELKFVSNGKTYIAGDKALVMNGFSGNDYSVNMADNAQYDGGSVAGVKIEPRALHLELLEEFTNRINYLAFFNPKHEGTLTITVEGKSRSIGYYIEKFNVRQENLCNPPVLEIDLICPDPYFYDVDNFGKNIAGKVALYAFPFVWLSNRDIVSDYKVFTDETLIVNRGDVETGLIINFTCTGAVTNPKIELMNTGEYMRILRTMAAGDTIQFETNTARKNIYVNGEKYTNFDPSSTFFRLAEGDNILKYGSDSGYESLNVYVYYRAKYLGVI